MQGMQYYELVMVLQWLLLSYSTLALSSGRPPPQPLRQTAADKKFDLWCDENGIVRVGVQTITTSKSLGGRGLFAVKPLRRGSVVASIPAELVICASSASNQEWQVSLTNEVISQKDENEWIQSWERSEALNFSALLVTDDADVLEYVNSIVGQGRITRSGAEKDVKLRMGNFNRRFGQSLSSGAPREEIAEWYTLVMSRSSYLGKEWDYRSGIVPFFDMLNHCHESELANTDLVTFGSCLDRQSEDAKERNQSTGLLGTKDMLLVLTRDVCEGQELLTQYYTEIDDEETQLKLWIQYGIPPP